MQEVNYKKITHQLCFSLILVLLCSGCEFIAPNTSKAISENKQLEELQKQNSILIDIANSLKRIAKNSENEK